jgi:ribosome biogenesis GTPase
LFEAHAARGLALARVAIAQRNHYQLLTESGELAGEPSGALLYQAPDRAALPVTGDWVAARLAGSSPAMVEAVLPRRTLFSRRAAGRREEEQPLAANIDLVFLVCGLDADFNLRRLERYLTLAAEAGTEVAVVLNKSDLCADVEARLRETAAVARDAPIVAASTLTAGGLDALRAFLGYGRTVALLGSSGVGKSAIVNGLIGEDRLRTGEVRESDGRGCHTSTRRELIPLPGGGALIDTPGMRELQLWAGRESLDTAFDEIAEMAARCRFRDCTHSTEPGCAVRAAIEEGSVSGDRWQSYRKLLAETQHHEEKTDPAAAANRKKRWKTIHRNARAMYKLREKF